MNMRNHQLMQQPWVSRIYKVVCECYDYCPPRAWLLLYYPLAHIEDIAYRLLGSHAERQYCGQAIVLVVLPLFYFILKKYGLWEHGASITGEYMRGETENKGSFDETDARCCAPAVPDEFLDTPVEQGLTEDQVTARRKIYGLNVAWEGRNWRACIWDFSRDPAHVLSEAAVVLDILHHKWLHVLLLSIYLALEFHAWSQSTQSSDDVAGSIAFDGSSSAVVVRDGTLAEIAAKDLVPGDIVHISEGTTVPVDGRIVSLDDELLLDLSSITGESHPVRKYEDDLCYAGTGVVLGNGAWLMATHTGRNTFLGRTISMVRGSERKAGAQNANAHYVDEYNVAVRSLGTCILVTLMAIVTPIVLGQYRASWSMFSPEPIRLIVGMGIVTIRLSPTSMVMTHRACGSAKLLEHGCIVQSTEAAESFAGIKILCCDKTGTITGNRLSQLEPLCLSCDPDTLILTASLCCAPEKNNLNPLDRAVMRALKQFPQARANVDRHRLLDFQPFDGESRTTRALVQSPSGEQFLCVVGAPKPLLELCLDGSMEEAGIEESYIESARDCARRGYRALGVARKRENMAWELLGLLPFHDPPRGDTSDALNLASQLSVSIRLLTGDAVTIAKTFCESIGIDSANVLDASLTIDKPTLNTEEIDSIVSARAYSEVDLSSKAKILETLQNHGNFVAMTGDGSNEATYLRKADCGIAVDGAAELAQSASDVVFNKPGLWYIVQAIQTSRQIFQQSHNYIVQRTVLLLNVLSMMLWHYFVCGEVFDLRSLILTTQVSDFIMSICRVSSLEVPFSQEPVRWSYKCLLREILPLTVTINIGSLFCMLTFTKQVRYIPSSPVQVGTSAQNLRGTRRQVLTLYILLSDQLMSCLTHTDGRFWTYSQNRKALSYILCFDLLVMLFYNLGWAGEDCQLSVITICYIWIVCVITISAAAAFRYLTYRGRLITRLERGKKEA